MNVLSFFQKQNKKNQREQAFVRIHINKLPVCQLVRGFCGEKRDSAHTAEKTAQTKMKEKRKEDREKKKGKEKERQKRREEKRRLKRESVFQKRKRRASQESEDENEYILN